MHRYMHVNTYLLFVCFYLNCLIRIHDDGDKNTENNVDEETSEEIKIQAAEPPHDCICLAHCGKSCEDIITVDETEETLRCCAQFSELQKQWNDQPSNINNRDLLVYHFQVGYVKRLFFSMSASYYHTFKIKR